LIQVYATDLKAALLSTKVKELRAAVLANDECIRQLSAVLKEEEQAVLDLIGQINAHRAKLRRGEAKAMWQRKVTRAKEAIYIGKFHRRDVTAPSAVPADWHLRIQPTQS
jgi:hypothetical protein